MNRASSGRTAVITGGGSGIGLRHRPPAGRRGRPRGRSPTSTPTPGAAAADEVDGLFVRTDVTAEAEVEALFAAAVEAYGSVDVAFNNAGISPPDDDSILTTGLDAWRRVQEVNLTSVYLCCQRGAAAHAAPGRGSIINTASFVAVMGAATSQISYTASKGGVLAMTPRAGRAVRPRGDPGERAVPRPGRHPAAAGAVRRRPRAARSGGWCTSRWAASPRPRRSPPPSPSWPATTPRFITASRSWSTAASPAPTSPRSERVCEDLGAAARRGRRPGAGWRG